VSQSFRVKKHFSKYSIKLPSLSVLKLEYIIVITPWSLRCRVVLDSESAVAALFTLASLTFCPRLLDIVRSVSPPPHSWFESLSQDIQTTSKFSS
jgi:hypothetical protein